MALIKSVDGVMPEFGENCYLAENATIVGKVKMGKDCSVWFNAVVRGDVNDITIGDATNIQDGAVIHATYQKAATIIGNNVSIGHNAIVHGCTIQDNVLIGMGAIVMDKALIGEGAVIAAGAVVTQGTIVEPNTIYAGMPAKKIKDVSPEMAASFLQTSRNYIMYADWFRDNQNG
jgi:carbonic anhydrase/acetyltransferase-like protein (isoleucine patch superfamily)